MSFLDELIGEVIDFVSDSIYFLIDGLVWLVEAVVDFIEWTFDSFVGVVVELLRLGYEVISIFLPDALNRAIKEKNVAIANRDQIEGQLANWAEIARDITDTETIKKNQEAVKKVEEALQTFAEIAIKNGKKANFYQKLIEKGANEAVIAVKNGQVDQEKTHLANSSSQDISLIREAHGKSGIKIYH